MRASHTLIALASGLPLLLGAATASAHFTLMSPPNGASADGKGAPPCGPDTGDTVVTPVTGGSQIMLNVKETVRHGGFYRVALALKSCKKDVAGMPKCFPDNNKVYDKNGMLLAPTGPGDSDHADIDPAPKFPILADGLFPHTQAADGTGPDYTGMINIPNVTCDKCTLQVIEFMAPHGPNGSAGYFYHHCAELKITADPGKPIFDPNGTGGSGAGGSGAGGAAGTAGTASTGGSGGAAAGTAGTSAGGTAATTAGTASTTAGTASTTAGTATTAGTGGTGAVTPPGGGGAEDDGGCGIAKRTQGGASALAALGLLFALVRRRRAS